MRRFFAAIVLAGCSELDDDCDDGVACTDDRCQDPDGVCSRLPDHASCNEGELCDAQRGCEAAP